MPWIYHLTTDDAWNEAKRLDTYRAKSLTTEGFIHASTADQLEASANRHFSQTPRVLLLKINPERLQPRLVWETSPHSETPFPHLYGPLNLDAVETATPWEADADGRFSKAPGVLLHE